MPAATTGAQQTWSATADDNKTADAAINLRENQGPSTYNNAVRAAMAALAKFFKDVRGGLVTAGTSTAYTLTTNEVFAQVLEGLTVRARINVTSGAAPTLNVDGTGAVAIQTIQGTAVPRGFLLAGGIYAFTYYAASAAWIVHSSMSKYVGEVFDFSGPDAPPLCVFAYGQAISRTTYAGYFAIVGETYGVGDGATTFNVPDCRGRVVAGQDDMGGSSANRLTALAGGIEGDTLGAVGGAESHQLTTAQMPAHTHTANVTDPGHTHTIAAGGTTHAVQVDEPDRLMTDQVISATSSATTGISVTNANAGSDTAHNNVQPTIMLNKCIFVGA